MNTYSVDEKLLHLDLALQTRAGKNITAIRFSCSGDMRGRADLEYMILVAQKYPHIRVYTYTHRSDIMEDISINDLPDNLTINLSYIHDKPGFNTFCLVDDIQKVGIPVVKCPGKCFKGCNICQHSKGVNIGVDLH